MTGAGDVSARELHDISLGLASGAALRIRGVLEAAPDPDAVVESKSTPTDLVTVTDRDTEAWLVARIGELRPQDSILGEEGGPRHGSTSVRWVLDPIDGTVNFVLGLPQFAVSVAAEVDGEVVAGAVANPATGEVFHAVRGGGAWLRDTAGRDVRLGGPRVVPLHRAVVATGFGYDAGGRERQIAVVASLLPRIADVRRLGAAALDLCFVAAGRLDAYFEAGLNPWDHAAGGLVAREAGCIVTGPDGRGDSRLLIAAGPHLAAEFEALLLELGADRVVGDHEAP